MRMLAEPSHDTFTYSFSRYFFATRPPFLLATLAACLLGQTGALYSGVTIHFIKAIVTILLAALLHAAVNVLNDYFDAKNGTDGVNTSRVYPYTGGSRFIQNGILTPAQMRNFGWSLLGIATLGGLGLMVSVGVGLMWLGLFGVFIGWAYSATPLRLNARGLGEWCVMLGFLGVVIGGDFVQRQAFSFQPIAVGLSYALLVTNLLYINQFPDREADAFANKRTLIVRLPWPLAVSGYALIALLATIWLVAMVCLQHLPMTALISLLPVFLAYKAFLLLKQNAQQPHLLRRAIQFTLASMLGHAVLLGIILFWTAP